MEKNRIIKEVNGIIHYINPEFEKVFDGTESRKDTNISPVIISEQDIEIYERIQKELNAKKYLNETDWYVNRFIETGKKIPEEVLIKRNKAREDINT